MFLLFAGDMMQPTWNPPKLQPPQAKKTAETIKTTKIILFVIITLLILATLILMGWWEQDLQQIIAVSCLLLSFGGIGGYMYVYYLENNILAILIWEFQILCQQYYDAFMKHMLKRVNSAYEMVLTGTWNYINAMKNTFNKTHDTYDKYQKFVTTNDQFYAPDNIMTRNAQNISNQRKSILGRYIHPDIINGINEIKNKTTLYLEKMTQTHDELLTLETTIRTASRNLMNSSSVNSLQYILPVINSNPIYSNLHNLNILLPNVHLKYSYNGVEKSLSSTVVINDMTVAEDKLTNDINNNQIRGSTKHYPQNGTGVDTTNYKSIRLQSSALINNDLLYFLSENPDKTDNIVVSTGTNMLNYHSTKVCVTKNQIIHIEYLGFLPYKITIWTVEKENTRLKMQVLKNKDFTIYNTSSALLSNLDKLSFQWYLDKTQFFDLTTFNTALVDSPVTPTILGTAPNHIMIATAPSVLIYIGENNLFYLYESQAGTVVTQVINYAVQTNRIIINKINTSTISTTLAVFYNKNEQQLLETINLLNATQIV